MPLRSMLARVSVMVLVTAALGAGTVQAQQSTGAMVIFDGSGSMWGNIEGGKGPKHGLAREALRQTLSKSGPGTRVGLMSFGHRRKGDCGDVEVMVPLEEGPAERIFAPLEKLNPKGKGPIAAALREAGKAVAGRGAGGIVLIHDNSDNCQQDMCAAAGDLAKAAPGVPVFAVGMALEAEEAGRMACVAQATGGRFVNAANATALGDAIGEALRASLSGRDKGSVSGAGTTPQLLEEPKPAARPAAPEGFKGLDVVASLSGEQPLIELPVLWRVKPESGESFEVFAPGLQKAVPPGRYTVEARFGGASAARVVDVSDKGATRSIVPLEAGLARFVVRAAKAGEAAMGTSISVFAAKGGKVASGEAPVWVGRETAGDVTLPVGTYVVRFEQGLAPRKEASMTIEAGMRSSLEVVMGTGRLQLAMQDEGGGGESLFIIAEDDPGAARGYREIWRTTRPKPDVHVAAGTYLVLGSDGSNEVRQRISVGAGETVKQTLVADSGRLAVSVTVPSTGAAGRAIEPAIKVMSDEKAPREVGRAFGHSAEMWLRGGKYKVTAKVGGLNATAAGEVEVKSGKPVQLALKIAAGLVTLKAADAGDGEDLYWEIADGNGRVVGRTREAAPTDWLAPGRYVVKLERKGGMAEASFVVASGEARSVVLGGR